MNNTLINPSSTNYNITNEKITYVGANPSVWVKAASIPESNHYPHHQEQPQIHYNTNIYNTVQYSAALYGGHHVPHNQQESDYCNDINISGNRLQILANHDSPETARSMPNQQEQHHQSATSNNDNSATKEEYLANNGGNNPNGLLYYQPPEQHNQQQPAHQNCSNNEDTKDAVIQNGFYKQNQQHQQGARNLRSRNNDRRDENASILSSSTDCSSLAEEANQKNNALDGIKLSENELEQISVRDLNKLLQGQERELVTKVKAKRRTLKNRGYALKCRSRRVEIQNQLMIENKALKAEVHLLRQQLNEWHSAKSELFYLRSEVTRLRTQLQSTLEKTAIRGNENGNFLPAPCPPFYDPHAKLDAGGVLRAEVSMPMNFAAAFNAVNRCLLSSVPSCCIATPLENQIIEKVMMEENTHWSNDTNGNNVIQEGAQHSS